FDRLRSNRPKEVLLHVHKQFEFDFQSRNAQIKVHLRYKFSVFLTDVALPLLRSYKLRYKLVLSQSGFQQHHHAGSHEWHVSLRPLPDVPTVAMDLNLQCSGFVPKGLTSAVSRVAILLVNDRSRQYAQSHSYHVARSVLPAFLSVLHALNQKSDG